MRSSQLVLTTLTTIALTSAASLVVAATAGADRDDIQFIAHQADVEVQGHFSRFSADVQFDPRQVQRARVDVDIDAASVDAGGGDTNALLNGPAFFDSARFPHAHFHATTISAGPSGHFRATGPMTIKGRTIDTTFEFSSGHSGNANWVEGGGTVSRLAFQVGEGQWADTSTVDDAVQIRFRLGLAPGH
jgi:polyisoprenoid-binding protein YceI